jgi:hypothetical protein
VLIDNEEIIDFNTFQIELIDFKKGSAVPAFAFSQRSENRVGERWNLQREIVNNKFEELLEISSHGSYGELKEMYPQPIERNVLVENLYNFINGFGNSPISVVDYDRNTDSFKPIYKIHKFKSALKKQLITEEPISIINAVKESDVFVGQIKRTVKGKITRNKILSTYSREKFSIEYAPDVIVGSESTFLLKHPLRCLFEKEENYYVIHSEILGIIGTGLTQEDTERSFSEEFEYLYNKLNSLADSSLTKHNQLIKNILNQLVEKTE